VSVLSDFPQKAVMLMLRKKSFCQVSLPFRNRARYDRSRLRYPPDLTDDEWALISPRLPRGKRGGNKIQ
jgi:hypothetical protein